MNSNDAEVFNSILAKYIGGKRINYCKSNCYKDRCYGTVLVYKSGQIFTETYIRTYCHQVLFFNVPCYLIF